METRQKVSGVEQLTPARVAGAEAFLATVRREHARFLETLGQAAALLGPDSEQLEQACAAQAQLTRQFLDAQRSILQLRAETDKELALIGAVPGGRSGRADADEQDSVHRRQLSVVLDQWWADEGGLRRSVIDQARQAVQDYLARLAESDAAVLLPTTATRVLAELDVAEAADLHSLLDELIDSLDAVPAVAPLQPTAVVDPDALRFVDGGTSEEFVQFWAAREPVQVAATTPRRWRFVPSAVYPVAAVASLLTLAMAWMG